jgi:hypothetical protein
MNTNDAYYCVTYLGEEPFMVMNERRVSHTPSWRRKSTIWVWV